MAIKVRVLGSGSKGNCTLITDDKTHVIIDAGLNPVVIITKLKDLGLEITDIDALLITHEHDDHIKGAEALAEFLPVYSHPDTLEEIQKRQTIPLKHVMEAEEKKFSIGTLDVTPFRVSHDAVHPYGYCIEDWESKFCYMTDTGYISKGMMNIARGSNIVMIESNHDKELLLRGQYPEYLKRRILSDRGHLSNAESACASFDLIDAGTDRIILAHISEQNNLPELAYWTTANYLKARQVTSADCKLIVASQRATVFAE